MKHLVRFFCAALCGCLLAACVHVPAYQQERLSASSMVFDDSLVSMAGSGSGLAVQIEPGAESSGGAQSSGCSACQ